MSMAEAKGVFDEIDADIVDAGQGVSHAKVREWLRSSGKPDELPCSFPSIR
jgi:hypothetical protein